MRRILFLSMALGYSLYSTAFGLPSNPTFLTEGNKQYLAKDYAGALKSYQAAVNADPNDAAAYQGIGNCNIALGLKGEALAAYQKSLQLKPNNPSLSDMVQRLQQQPQATPVSSGQAAAKPKELKPKTIEIELEGGIGISSDLSIRGTYSAPMGSGAVLYYLSPQVRIGVSGSYFAYTHSYYTLIPAYDYDLKISFLNILAVGKYDFGWDRFRPFILAGAGLSTYTVSTKITSTQHNPDGSIASVTNISNGTVSASYPVLEGGLGIEYVLTDDFNLFAQGRYDLILVSNGSIFMAPIEGGINFSF